MIERQAALIDLAIETLDRMLDSGPKPRAEAWRLVHAEASAEVADHHLILGRALVEARRDANELSQAVEGSLGWDRVATSFEGAAGVLGAHDGDLTTT